MDGACGLAALRPMYFSNSASIGFVAKDCNTNVLAHELGHIFGAQHNREEGGTVFPDVNYGWGYLIRGTDQRTVMALVLNLASRICMAALKSE